MTYADIMNELNAELANFNDDGKVACYIPELGNVNPDRFGMCLRCNDGKSYGIGDSNTLFSIQSISKVINYTIAYKAIGEALLQRVGVEPSGDPFNSLVQLEFEKGIPRNPFINAGAILVCDVLLGEFGDDACDTVIGMFETLSGSAISVNERVLQSEKAHGFNNAALANLMKAHNNIHNPIDKVLDLYFTACSIEMTCYSLAQAFSFLANDGRNPLNNEIVIAETMTKRVNSIMQTCGFYDEAGEFSFRVGLPGKSGVGGGIVAVLPGHYSVAVWSPRLNAKGNSVKGMYALEFLTHKSGDSIF